jgi:hypothetical protein
VIDYRGFTIAPKRDFIGKGFYINGAFTKRGYVVVKDGCNAMPGATWFHTIESAKEAIDILIEVGGADIWNPAPDHAARFWERMSTREAR